MKTVLPSLLLVAAGIAAAQERCDAPYPNVYCNTTEIAKFHSDDCTPFHVFISRGSDEPYPGRLGNLTSQICDDMGGTKKCSYEDVEYPAKSTAWGAEEWCKSASKGAKAGQEQFKAYNKKCPDSKLILLGYSQGASVAQDILGGGGGPVFECEQDENPAMDATTGAGKNVVAAVTFGAVVRTRDQNFTIGSGKDFDGTSARTPEHLEGLKAYSDVLLDYCHFGDPICAIGSEPQELMAHLDYFLEHNAEVKKWVVQMAKASDGQVSSKPSKPAAGSSNTSVPARPAVTSVSPSLISASATPTDGSSPAQSGDATGAASSMSVAAGSTVALAMAMTFAVLL